MSTCLHRPTGENMKIHKHQRRAGSNRKTGDRKTAKYCKIIIRSSLTRRLDVSSFGKQNTTIPAPSESKTGGKNNRIHQLCNHPMQPTFPFPPPKKTLFISFSPQIPIYSHRLLPPRSLSHSQLPLCESSCAACPPVAQVN